MKKTLKFSFVFLIAFCFTILPCMSMIATAQAITLSEGSLPSAPTITSPQGNQSYTSSDLCVNGFTQNGTYVEVYVNDRYDGDANIRFTQTVTAAFDYCKPFSLTAGYHSISVRAVNSSNPNLKSDFVSVGFKIVSYPAPILQRPAGQITTRRPALEGLAPSGAIIEVFYDNLSYGTYQVGTHVSGTAGFSIVVNSDLNYDSHIVYVIATSPDGTKISEQSNTLQFTIVPPGTIINPVPGTTPTTAPDSGPAYPAPTLLEPTGSAIIGIYKPEIKGVAYSNSIIDVFIDGKPNGTIKVGSHPSGIAGFVYRPSLDLSAGIHTVYATARNSAGKKSKVSNTLTFQTGNYYPAPVISNTVKAVSGPGTSVVQGVVKSNSIVKIYLDNKYYGEIKVGSHPSGTSSFVYKLNRELGAGAHKLYTIAIDGSGKTSKGSNIISFNYAPPVIAKEETEKEPAEIVPVTPTKEATIEKPAEEPVAVTTESGDTSVAATKEGEGSTKESDLPIQPAVTKLSTENEDTTAGSDQGKSVGLIVLIAVIVLLVLWFFWVNKDYFIKKAKGFQKKAEVIEGELEKEVKGPEAVSEDEEDV